MELNSQTNVFTQGMDLDTDVSMIPEGKYRYAENVRLITNDNGTSGALQNIENIKQYATHIPSDEQILGTSNTLLFDHTKGSTYEVGIILTKKQSNNAVYNTLYVVDNFESQDINITPVVYGYLEINNNVNIVCNYESDKISKVYITDGETPIKVINIAEQLQLIDTEGLEEVSDPTRFDITPGAVLIPFNFQSRINGVLPAGAVQYAYLLFNLHGSETAISALSEVIPIVNRVSNSKKAKGGIKGDITDMGCQIKAQFINDGRFDRMRIFAIVYLNNTAVPNIYIASEIKIPYNKQYELVECVYNDSGNGYMSQITIDEFNALIPYEFTATSIEKLQNRLFAANVREKTWDIAFDARAYRCDSTGYIQLNSGSGDTIRGMLTANGTIKDLTGSYNINIPEYHDCVNPSNTDVLGNNQVYSYGYENGVLVHGGSGPNVSYRFTYTPIILSDATAPSSNVMTNRSTFECTTRVLKLNTYYEGLSSIARITIIPQESNVIPNYSDPYVCANFLGYQRDEIYRFGIIFYNNKNIPSPVHWIGDIKMPASYMNANSFSELYPFHCGRYINTNEEANHKEMTAFVLGIEFKIKNVPDEVYAYEIVRCDRTQSDRTVVCQGALGATMAYTHADEYSYNYGDVDTRPMPALMLPKRGYYMLGDWDGEYHLKQEQVRSDCFEFASPEICISGLSISPLISSGYLNPLYYVASYLSSPNRDPELDLELRTNSYGVIPTNVHNIGGTDEKTVLNYYYEHGGLTGKGKDGVLCYFLGANGGKGDSERCGIMKYYIAKSQNDLLNRNETCYKIEDSIVSQALPMQRDYKNLRDYVQFVGDYAYVNASFHVKNMFPNHGICGVLIVKDFDKFIPLSSANVSPQFSEFNTTAICNIKRNIVPYGGNSYINRQTSVYQSCGAMVKNDEYIKKIHCWGGDTYLCVFDYQNTVIALQENDIASGDKHKICHVSYIPVETVINLNYRTTDSFNSLTSEGVAENRIQLEPITYQDWVQDEPLYAYNSVYSVQSGSKQYIPKGVYAEDDMVSNCRIMCSESKNNNELLDSWTKFKVANYLDVDTKYGPITNLKSFNNKLYYWQNSAVGIAAVNERSLIVDNNIASLTLGTGGILTRFDYVTETNGSSIENDKSIVTTSNYIYWYDFDKNVICQLGANSIPLSKSMNVQSYLNGISDENRKNSVGFYDHKYNELWFKINDKSIVYNERLNVFTSFYTHSPNWVFPFSDKLVTIKNDNTIYLHNLNSTELATFADRISKIKFVVNKDITNTKVFDNVVFSADLLDNNNEIPAIIKDVVFKTKTQETEPLDYTNIEIREDNYRFPIPREKSNNPSENMTINKSYLGRLRGKYLICDYTFDCNENREFKIPFIKTTYRYSML